MVCVGRSSVSICGDEFDHNLRRIGDTLWLDGEGGSV